MQDYQHPMITIIINNDLLLLPYYGINLQGYQRIINLIIVKKLNQERNHERRLL